MASKENRRYLIQGMSITTVLLFFGAFMLLKDEQKNYQLLFNPVNVDPDTDLDPETIIPLATPADSQTIATETQLVVDTIPEPIQIKNIVLQEDRFEFYEAEYQVLVERCREKLGVDIQSNIDIYMLALIKNTHIGENGGIKLVYSPGFDHLFAKYGFNTQEQVTSSLAQVCVGYDILISSIDSNNSIVAGFAQYNGGIHAAHWWNQYMSYLGSDGESQLIRTISSGNVPSDPEYLKFRQKYIDYLTSQGEPGDYIAQRVETFVTGSIGTIYP